MSTETIRAKRDWLIAQHKQPKQPKPVFDENHRGRPFYERMRRFRTLNVNPEFRLPEVERPAVVEELRSSGGKPISIAELATKLEVLPTRLQILIDNEYLRVVIPSAQFESTVVARPPEDAIQWLKQMLQPITRQPFVRLADVHEMMKGYKGREINKKCNPTVKLGQLCMAYGIQLLHDPVFGELLTIEGLNKLLIVHGISKKAKPKNRTGMLAFLLEAMMKRRLDSGRSSLWKLRQPHELRTTFRVPQFHQSLELEINRIANLPDPQRTLRAIALREAWQDARKVSDILGDYRKIVNHFTRDGITTIDRRMDELHQYVIEKLNKSKDQNGQSG